MTVKAHEASAGEALPLSPEQLNLINAWWRAANYLSVGQIYLLDNPLLREPLKIEHVKPRLLGHWGTAPGLNFIRVHLNRIIRERDLTILFIGPGHGAPGEVTNSWLEGTYSEFYPEVSQDEMACAACSVSFPFRAESRAMPLPKRLAQSMKAASSVMRSHMPMERSWTTLT
jgi:xylulose-5-phosphate/fructose-6-phosphate phosphoketolase